MAYLLFNLARDPRSSRTAELVMEKPEVLQVFLKLLSAVDVDVVILSLQMLDLVCSRVPGMVKQVEQNDGIEFVEEAGRQHDNEEIYIRSHEFVDKYVPQSRNS